MSLTFEELRSANSARGKLWNTGKYDFLVELLFRSNEMAGEVGEAANKVKKLARTMLNMKGGQNIDTLRAEIAEELGDIVICVDRVAEIINVDLGQATADKFNKTSAKHGFPVKLN